MDIGKLPAQTLTRLLARAKPDPGVIIGPAYGEDAAAVRVGGRVLVAASDPITFATDRIGRYAVSVNANDIVVMGAEPRYFLATILLPAGSAESEAEAIFDQIESACEDMGVALIGGHTEITDAVQRPVVCGTMLGEVDEDKLISSSGARVGDVLVLAGDIAIEGASILAREASADLLAAGVRPELVKRAKFLLDDPGISILDCAHRAIRAGGVTAMHDPTEGGIITAIRELAASSNKGIEICRGSIPILDTCAAFCDALGLDPLGLIASGSLLIAVAPESAQHVIDLLAGGGRPAGIIGTFREMEFGVRWDDGADLPSFQRDEIARYFENRKSLQEKQT